MNVQLRNSNGYPGHVPIALPRSMRSRRFGIGDSNINPTTIWTPQTGFLNQPGTLTQGYQFQPQVTSVYDVPGLLLPYQSCIDSQGGSSGSEACVNQNLATEQENFRRTAAYNAGTLKLPAVIPPAPTPPASTTQTTTQTTPASTPAQKIADTLTGESTSSGGSTSTTPPATSNSTLYWIAGLAAAGVLLYAAVNR